MQARQRMRIGALCALLYVLLFVAGQVYLGIQAQIPSTRGLTPDGQDRVFLLFVHAHHSVLLGGGLLAMLGYLTLVGVAYGVAPLLSWSQPRMARIVLIVGVAAVIASVVVVLGETFGLINVADQYATATSDAGRHAASHAFHDRSTQFTVTNLASGGLLAIWLGLIGSALLRIDGRSSLRGWGTVGTCIFVALGVSPLLIAWSAGAAVGLWRLSTAVEIPAALSSEIEPAAVQPRELRPRPVRGSAARRGRRR